MSKDRVGPVFSRTQLPVVSVVVPVHGKWSVTAQCLASLAADTEATSFEVIVVDDCSPDDTAAQLARVPGLTTVKTATNLGFLGASNLGASKARGGILVFLNNDTIVRPGWLDRLVDVLDRDPAVGLVGSMLLSIDGLVQESGGIIWADGTGKNYGRGMAPDRVEVRGLRDVDYCSGAAIAVRTELFMELGGFDRRYEPAYYEDTDLSFAVRAAGYRVVVQPESVVVHLEGVSHGKDSAGGIKRFQEVNREVFLRKWRDVLSTHGQMTGPGDLWVARNRRPNGMVLIIDSTVPTPDRDSGSRRMMAIIDELLAMGLSVHLASAAQTPIEPYTRDLERKGVTVLITAEEQERFLAEAGGNLDAVILCRPNVAWSYMDLVYVHAPHAVVVYDTVDLHSLRMRRQAEFENDPGLNRLADLVWVKESAAMRAADVTFVVSEVERDLLADLVPDVDVRILSNVHAPVVTSANLAGRSEVVFIGGYQHLPNIDAATWAAQEIMPRVRRVVPDAVLRLIGSHMPPEVTALAGPGVEAVGWAPELAPLYAAARVAIAPLRFGAGVKGKVAEAVEHGVPLVGTTMALEGIHLVDGVDVLTADDADKFAQAIVRLLTDDELWLSMATSGQRRLVEQFSAKVARDALENALNEGRRQRAASRYPVAERLVPQLDR